MNFFEKDKKNSFFLTNLEIESAYKNFSELTSEEITSIKKIKSEKTTPRSVKKACLIPFDMLVSNNIKNNGPKENDKRKPKGNAAKYSAINLLLF